MPWDDELERLTQFVLQTFGDQELEAAVDRALPAVRVSTPSDVGDGGAITSAVGSDITLDDEPYYEALRTELRRLARPH